MEQGVDYGQATASTKGEALRREIDYRQAIASAKDGGMEGGVDYGQAIASTEKSVTTRYGTKDEKYDRVEAPKRRLPRKNVERLKVSCRDQRE